MCYPVSQNIYNSPTLNFNYYFMMEITMTLLLTHCVMSIGIFQVDAMTYGDLGVAGEHGRTDRHAQWLIYFKPSDSNSTLPVDSSFNFTRLSVYRFRSINNTARPMCNQYTNEASTWFSGIKQMHKSGRSVWGQTGIRWAFPQRLWNSIVVDLHAAGISNQAFLRNGACVW